MIRGRVDAIRKLVRVVRDGVTVRAWVALCVLVAVLVSAPRVLSSRFVTERRAARSLKLAQAHLAAREFDQARSEFRAALRMQPNHGDARHQLAAMELGLGNWELAFLEFQSLTELHPEDPNGWIGFAGLMVKSGLLGTPEAALDKAIAAAPKRADAHLLRGDIRFRSGRYHGARLDAEAAVAEEARTDAASWALLVRSAAHSQGTQAGIEAAERGIAAVGRDPALLQPLAFLLAGSGRTREGVTILEQIIGAQSGSATAWNAQLTLARVELRAGNREAARKQLDTLLLQRPGDEEALALGIVLDAAGGRVEAAVARLDAALQGLPKSRTLRDLHDRLQSARDDSAAIAALLVELIGRELGPAPVPSSRLRAEAESGRGKLLALAREHWPGRLAQMRQALEVQLRQQDWSAAQRILEAARRTYADSAFAPFLAGILELARGNADEAEQSFFESLKSAPRSPVVAAGLAKAWSRKKGATFAGTQLMRLAERDAGFGFARYLAARAFMDGREPIQAEAAVRRGFELQPDSSVPYQQLADYYLDLDRTADVLGILHQGLDRFPQDLDLQLMLAQVSADLGKAKDAIGIYDHVLSRRPDLDLVEYKLASLVASEDKDNALSRRLPQIVEHLQSDLPSDPLLLDRLGWMHFRAGATSRARHLLEAAVNGAPDEPGPHYHLAAVYARENKADLARSQLKVALDSSRPFAERLDAMRLLRDSSSTPGPKGSASATSPGR
jgi:tetratricopeptide (TPR) repeat protein